MLFNRLENGIVQCQRDFDDSWTIESNVTNFLWDLESEGTGLYMFGEPGCAGNWDMYITLYDVYADVVYLVLYSECNKYEAGEMIELHPQPVTMDDRVRMVEESGDLSNLYQLRIVTDLESDGDNWYENDGYNAEEVVIYDGDDVLAILKELGYEFPEDCEVNDDHDVIDICHGEKLLAYFVPAEGAC